MAGEEAKIEQWVCEQVKTRLGVENVKMGLDGWPDRVFLVPGGRPFFIEFKRPGGGVLAPRQAERIRRLELWGYSAEVHDDRDEAYVAVKQFYSRWNGPLI